MSEEEKRNTSSLRLDFNKMITFHQKYMMLHDLVSDTTSLYCKYWSEYLRAKPGILPPIVVVELNDLVNDGFQISLNCERIEDTLQLLASIDPNNIKGVALYALFQKHVMEDEIGAFESFLLVKRQEESRSIAKRGWDEADTKYGADSNTAVIILSGNRKNIGTIVNANHEIGKLLGYQKNELVGENIAVIMPEIMGAHHNLYLENYFERHDQSNEVSEKLIFPQHAKGYIVPCLDLVRLVPNLDSGVQFLGFVALSKDLSAISPDDGKVSNSEVLLILLDTQRNILGFNRNVLSLCSGSEEAAAHLSRYLSGEQKVDMGKLYPELLSPDNVPMLHSHFGLTLTLDISLLIKAIGPEIVDSYSSEAGDESPHKGSSGFLPNIEALANRRQMRMTIRFTDFSNSSQMGKFTMCAMLPTDSHISKLLGDRQDSQEEEVDYVPEDPANKMNRTLRIPPV